jgi:hypothetical protein
MVGQLHEFPEQIAQEAKNKHDGENRHENNALCAGEEMCHRVSLLPVKLKLIVGWGDTCRFELNQNANG